MDCFEKMLNDKTVLCGHDVKVYWYARREVAERMIAYHESVEWQLVSCRSVSSIRLLIAVSNKVQIIPTW